MPRKFTVEEAVERHLKESEPEVSDSTLYNHRSALRGFISFCDSEGIENISDMDAFAISDFRLQCTEEVSNMTAYNNLSSVRKFICWCESRDLLEDGLADGMIMPNRNDKARDDHIEPETAKEILEYLEKYEYATLYHALFALLWNTGIRTGAARSLNLEDVSIEGKYISLSHQPEFDTPLKNGEDSERDVNLDSWVADILRDYINGRRIQTEEDHGNEPLFTTERGRAHRNTLTKRLNALTRPCYYSNGCPHDREINDCDDNGYMEAAGCPSSVSPHPIRRSAITYWLDEGHSKELLSDRMDVSVDVLEEHYDARSQEQKRELRREMLDIE